MSRPKGVPNKPKRALLRLLQEKYPGYHPVMEMAALANDEDADESIRFNANREVAKYVEPMLKAMEITAEVDGNITISWGKAE